VALGGTKAGHKLARFLQLIDFFGVPYRIRTGVAAVRGLELGFFRVFT
jgi:hypothetical protein